MGRFGISLEISGDTLIVSNPEESPTKSSSAYIFDRNAGGQDNWGEVAKLEPSDILPTEVCSNSHYQVSISGDTAILGACGHIHQDPDNPSWGTAFVFKRDAGGPDNWGETQEIIHETLGDVPAFPGREFGASAIDGSTIIIGAKSDLAGGAVFIFEGPILPSEIPFAAFNIEKAKVHLGKKAGKDKFDVKGRFTLGDGSDGIDVLNEDVTVTFNGFTETIPAGSFVRDDDDEGFEYKGGNGGITKVNIKDDGRFKVKGKDLDLSGIDLGNPIPFSLIIGDDVGETEIPFKVGKKGRKGKFKS